MRTIRRIYLPLCVILLLAGVLMLGAWSVLAPPRKTPISIRVVDVALVEPAPHSSNVGKTPAHERIQCELQNNSEHIVWVWDMSLQSAGPAATSLAIDTGRKPRRWLYPGGKLTHSLVAYSGTKTPQELRTDQAVFIYSWKSLDLRNSLENRMNGLRGNLPKALKALVPTLNLNYQARIEGVVIPPVPEQASAGPQKR